MGLYETIGMRIRAAREEANLSQEGLAKKLGVAPNTISRWETAAYKPRIEDIEKLAVFFKRSILEFFPSHEEKATSIDKALLRATSGMSDSEVKEVIRYAEFRRGRAALRRKPTNK